MKKAQKVVSLLIVLLVLFSSLAIPTGQSRAAASGFSISGRNLLDANGNNFIMRGINHAHTFFPQQTSSFANIKATGANTIRVVLSGGRWNKNSAADVANVISLCKANKLVCVLDDQDTTGYTEDAGAYSLTQAVNYWKEIQSVLVGQEAYVIINIGNEPYGNSTSVANWVADTKNAIAALRAAGFQHTLMVDAPNWGQDWQGTMKNNAASIFASDPNRNTIFSIHMYGVYNTAATIQSYLNTFVTANLPLVIGEFGDNHADGNPDEDTIMAEAQAKGIGYLGWSWSGNGNGVEYLDMALGFNPATLSTWGNRIINGANGIKLTSKEASIYGSNPTSIPGSNLALNKPVLCSSVEAGANVCANAVDGNSTTRWSSLYADPQWIRVDLGATQTINRVKLSWEAAYGKSYQIQTSNDDVNWTTIYTTTTGDGGIDDLTLTGSGRYVRVYGTVRGTTWGYSLFDFEVYGPTGPTSTPTNTATASNTPSITPTGIVTTPPPAGNLKVQLVTSGTDNTQQTSFKFAVKNTGTSAQSNISVRVYFTTENGQAGSAYALDKYWDQSGVATVTGPTLVSGNDYYFTVSYGTASLAAGATWEFHTAMHLGSWGSTYSGANDWWHTTGALPAAFTDWPNIPAYVGTTRAWGSEPGGSLQPDLTVTGMAVTLQAACTTQLGVNVTVKNIGTGNAGSFVVTTNGASQTYAAGLAAGQSANLWFSGYPAGGAASTATVDSTSVVVESNEANNSLTQVLPIPTLPPCITPTFTPTPSKTFTPSPTVSPTNTFTPTVTFTPSITPSPTIPPAMNFITRSGDKLMDGTKEFRFVSINIPNIFMIEDPNDYWHRPDEFEQEDGLKAVAQIGGRVVRTYTLSIKGGKINKTGDSHVTGPNQHNEELFVIMDRAIALAAKHKIRLIIPFIDQWDWIGGVKEFAAFRGKTQAEFWTDAQVRSDFKQTIAYVLNRTNTITGIQYKNDPTIMAWETGNEIYEAPDAWTRDISAYIKSIDSKHLVIDGKGGPNSTALNDPNIDVVTSHYYNYSDPSPFTGRAAADRNATRGIKPFFVGEYGLTNLTDMQNMTAEVVNNGSSGALIWSLRFHRKDGGWYFHNDGNSPVTSRSYHWPGFPQNDDYYETAVFTFLRNEAYRIQGLAVPPLPAPDGAPLLFAITSPSAISWRGSTGATGYNVERADSATGPWTVVGTNISDMRDTGPFFNDTSAALNKTYYYRVIGKNASGSSAYSNVVKLGGLEGTNLAIGKIATGSCAEATGTNTPDKAVDGNTTTRWSSCYVQPAWLAVDLGQTATINGVKLNWEAAYGKTYDIQVSSDGVNWSTAASKLGGTGGVDTLIFATPASARYVRMYGTERGTTYGFSLWEFEIYGSFGTVTATPSPTNPATITITPTFTTPTITLTPSITVTPSITPVVSLTPPSHMANPFVGATFYKNVDYVASVNAAANATGGTLGSQMRQVANYPTFLWMDSIAAVNGTGGYPRSLAGHLDQALLQPGVNTVGIVVYDLPNRDCSALASNGELLIASNGLNRYKTEYIDAIYATISQPKYYGLRMILVIEPDSLPNLITNLSFAKCQEAKTTGAYVQGVQYAVNRLRSINNTYAYIDVAHAGWLGWPNNMGPFVTMMKDLGTGLTGGPAMIDGFISNTANYNPVDEPFMDANTMVGGNPVRSLASWYDWNDHIDELTFITALKSQLTAGVGAYPADIGMLIDTSRNGWGGTRRPTAASTSTTLSTFVMNSRIDLRTHKGNWCNQSGAGIGARPAANPLPGIEAYVWVKPPGESDGSSSLIPTGPENPGGKGFDRMCDPTYTGNTLNGGTLTNALANAPVSGRWFLSQFVELVQNAYPPFVP